MALAAVLLWWVFRDQDLAEIWRRFREADALLLTLAVVVTTGAFAVRAARWRFFLAPAQRRSPFGSRFAAVSIGFMTNNLLPSGRLGEFARAYAYSRMEPVSAPTAFATLVVERFADGIVLLALLFLAVASPHFPADALPREVAAAVWGVMSVLGVALLFVLALLVLPDRTTGLAGGLASALLPDRWAAVAVRALEGFVDGLAALREWRLAVSALAWTFGLWLVQSFSLWLGFRAFDIELPFVAAVFLNTVLAFAASLPAAPGYFGTFHSAAKLVLVSVYGAPEAPAIAFATAWHLGSFFPITLMGLWQLRRLDMSFRDLRAAEPEEATEPKEAAEPQEATKPEEGAA